MYWRLIPPTTHPSPDRNTVLEETRMHFSSLLLLRFYLLLRVWLILPKKCGLHSSTSIQKSLENVRRFHSKHIWVDPQKVRFFISFKCTSDFSYLLSCLPSSPKLWSSSIAMEAVWLPSWIRNNTKIDSIYFQRKDQSIPTLFIRLLRMCHKGSYCWIVGRCCGLSYYSWHGFQILCLWDLYQLLRWCLPSKCMHGF